MSERMIYQLYIVPIDVQDHGCAYRPVVAENLAQAVDIVRRHVEPAWPHGTYHVLCTGAIKADSQALIVGGGNGE